MLPTRLLPPQFLLPAWNSRQLAQAAHRAHKSDYSKDNHNRRQGRQLGQGQNETGGNTKWRQADSRRSFGAVGVQKGPISRRLEYKRQRHGDQNADRTHDPEPKTQQQDSYETVLIQRTDKSNHSERFIGHRVFTPIRQPRYSETVVEMHRPKADKTETNPIDQEPESKVEGLSLFEELFPEEAMARQKRESTARKRLEKLPAFNWGLDTKELDAHDKRQQEARQKMKEKHRTIPGLQSENGAGRKILPAKQTPLSITSSQRTGNGQHTLQDQSRKSRSRVSVLVLNACSKRLEESDFYRVGPKGNHVEDWTSGILKVIPARDNVTLEPLGQYYLLFSSLAAARLYLDKTQRLLLLSKQSEYFSRHETRLREDEDLDSLKRNFTLVPAGGRLSLRLLEPPHSKGVQFMIDAAGPASLVTRQEKSQHIVLFSTDRGNIRDVDVENAIMDDGKRRNLHWKLAGTVNEAIVKLESQTASARELGESDASGRRRSTFQGPTRFTIAFRDSNEARRFAREWHRRPFPSSRVARPEEDAPPTVNAEILW